MRTYVRSLLVLGALTTVADAHIEVSSGPAAAGKSQVIKLSVGHGCTDTKGTTDPADDKKLDTVKLKVTIPAGVTGVRALFSDFGKPTVTKDGSGAVTAVEWVKPAGDLLDGDDAFYEIAIRAKIPDAAFTKLQFNVLQTCEDATTHAQIVVDWNAPEDATEGEPAPILTVVPVHKVGWNKIVVPRALTQAEVPTFLGDAQIVWKGNAAYSPNSITAAQIEATPGVTKLDGLAAGDEILVKY